MENFVLESFCTNVQTSTGTYPVWVWREAEKLALEIEEPSAKKSQFLWSADKLSSRQYQADKFKVHNTELPSTIAVEPLYESVGQEIKEVAAKAVQEYLQFEQSTKESQP